jgi:diguanylate cyclase (GGDEF)-like protein
MPVAVVLADATPARARAEGALRAAPGEWTARHARGLDELRPALAAGRCDVIVAADGQAMAAHSTLQRLCPDLPFLFDAARPARDERVGLLGAGARDVDLGDAEAAGAVLAAVVGTAGDRRRRPDENRAWLSFRDSLTGLVDGRAVSRHVDRAVARARRHALQIALVHVDVEGLDDADEGDAAAVQLACRVAERVEEVVRATDVVGREGGGCFVVLLADVDGDAEVAAASVAGALRSRLSEPLVVQGQEHRLAVRAGFACWPRDAAHGPGLAPAARAATHDGDTPKVTLPAKRRSAAPVVGRAERAALDRLLDDRAVTPVFQPVVDLDTGGTVAYEALARGPRGTLLERPDRLFALARRVGRLDELDWLCRVSALCAAADAGLRSPATLFVNVEPATLGAPCPPALRDDWARGAPNLRVVLEITERAVTARPAELLRVAEEVRRRGWGIALDYVGADTRSLALLPFVRPDIVKLDLRLLHEQTTVGTADIVNAVGAHAERTGALVLAEGIETPEQADLARAMGARLGQGWLFGRPGPLPAPPPVPARGLPLAGAHHRPSGDTPYTVVASSRPVRRADKGLLLTISRALESQAAGLGPTGVLLAAFQDVTRFSAATRARYREMADRAALVAVFGVGMDAQPLRSVRGAGLAADDALAGEWSVVLVGPHFAAALAAVDLGDDGPDERRRFDFAMTYERDPVLAAAETLLARVRGPATRASGMPVDGAVEVAVAQAGTRSARV